MKSFAEWEKAVRFLNSEIVIFTEADTGGQVVRAWTEGATWELVESSQPADAPRKMTIGELIECRFGDNKHLSRSERLLVDAWIRGTSSPSYADEDILKAIVAYGDSRAKDERDRLKKKK